jgi:hypothetical protein
MVAVVPLRAAVMRMRKQPSHLNRETLPFPVTRNAN